MLQSFEKLERKYGNIYDGGEVGGGVSDLVNVMVDKERLRLLRHRRKRVFENIDFKLDAGGDCVCLRDLTSVEMGFLFEYMQKRSNVGVFVRGVKLW